MSFTRFYCPQAALHSQREIGDSDYPKCFVNRTFHCLRQIDVLSNGGKKIMAMKFTNYDISISKGAHEFIQVCGNFTVVKNYREDMLIMVIVGGTLLSISTVPLIITALHHITRNSLQAESKRIAMRKFNLKDLPASFRITEANWKEGVIKSQRCDARDEDGDPKVCEEIVKKDSPGSKEYESSTTQGNFLNVNQEW